MLEDISLIDLPGVVEGGFGGHGVIAARIDGIVYVNTHLTPFSNDPDTSNRRAGAKAIVDRIVKKYEDEPLLVMGDHNNVSPEDKNRYDVDFLCANGGVTYCDHPNSPTDNTTVEINYDSIQEYLDAGLSDLCWGCLGYRNEDEQSFDVQPMQQQLLNCNLCRRLR